MTRPARQWAVIVACNTAGGLIPVALTMLFRPGLSAYQLWIAFLQGSAFSYCIGTLAFLVMSKAGPLLGKVNPLLRYPAFFVLFVAIALVGSLPATLICVAVGWGSPREYWELYRQATRTAIAITLLLGTVITIVETMHHRLEATQLELRTRQLTEEKALKLATEARLSSLESRVQPHFFFNTLNSISALIREDPARAERTVERLAALLRYSLDSNAQRVVALRQELRIVSDYLEIEKTRFGDRLRYTLAVPEGLEDLEVPPMALQTLVENSVKHAVAASRKGGDILVAARLEDGQLTVEVYDNGPGFDASSLPPGHGLENLQERLAVLYPGEGRFSVTRDGTRTRAAISLPQKRVLA